MASFAVALVLGLVAAAGEGTHTIAFDRDVRPILSNHCFACHGPDEQSRKGGLRLDDFASATATLPSGARAIVPGEVSASALVAHITAADPEDRMPPASFQKPLSEAQIETLTRWIAAGAKWEQHWAFVPPLRPRVPAVAHVEATRNPIDNFIVRRLEGEGLAPSPEADRRRLIRRVAFDVTGLPPTPEEVEAFVQDAAPDAYERMVDRYLASPRYGEHMARLWLDQARYADTNGYHIDNERYNWPWRDWVIRAYNDNMPFDQFTVEQIAGDLLPDATLSQKVASGFNRNHMINFEGGAIPEEYHMAYVVDRVVTTSQVWLGLTMNCAQCHDHKYDPISMRDFYQFYAFFNTVNEQGLDGREGNSPPLIQVPSPEQEARRAALKETLAAIKKEMAAPMPETDARQAAWEQELAGRLRARWSAAVPREAVSAGGATLRLQPDGSVLASGENPATDSYTFTYALDQSKVTAIRLEALADESLPKKGAGRFETSNFVLSEIEVEAADPAAPEAWSPVKIAAANADFAQENFPIERAFDGNPATGWAVAGHDRPESRVAVFLPERSVAFAAGVLLRVRLHFASEFPQHAIGRPRISVSSDEAMRPAGFGSWYLSGPFNAPDGETAYNTAYDPEVPEQLAQPDVRATLPDGRWKWLPQPQYADGVENALPGEISAVYLYRRIESPAERELTLLLGSNDGMKLWLNGALVHAVAGGRVLQADQDRVPVRLHAGVNHLVMKVVNIGGQHGFAFRRSEEQFGEVPVEIARLIEIGPEKRSAKEDRSLRDYYRSKYAPEWQALNAKLAAVMAEQATLEKQIPTAMIMAEMENPRKTYIMRRGQYDQPTEEVQPGTPAALNAMPAAYPRNRLGLARWLVDPSNPLTARVTVNRLWSKFFGQGLVRTQEDFGIQGERPSHPDLLDWLAVEFRESGWDMKAMQRLMLTSATYRQSAAVSPELLERDAQNVLLARGPRFRMDAEMVRDNALALSGLLVGTIGGPSVKPYQPPGLWEEVAYGGNDFTGQRFEQDHGEALYRRSMYIFWKRQAPPPQMLVFDAPNRETCTIRRARSNTPLQALALMNDVQYVEAARAMAQRMIREGGGTPEERLAWGFCLATARPPAAQELAVLQRVHAFALAAYAADHAAAEKLAVIGESPRDTGIALQELAAYTVVANMIMNLDEVISKG